MGASWTDIGTFILGCVIVVVEVGRWAGGIEGRRADKRRDVRETALAQTPSPNGTNGTPTPWELSRRIDRFENENARDHEEIRKDYRGINTAQTRRIERLEQLQ